MQSAFDHDALSDSEEQFEHLDSAHCVPYDTYPHEFPVHVHAAVRQPCEDDQGSAVVIDDLRKRRRTRGYMAEDGTTIMRGKEGDNEALFGEAWLKERLTRVRILDGNRDYQFAVKVAGNTNFPLQHFTNEDEIQRAVASSLAAAGRKFAEFRQAQRDRESGPDQIDSQERRVVEARARRLALSSASADLRAAKQCFLDAASGSPELVAEIDTSLQKAVADANGLFDLLTRTSVAIDGARGYTRANQRLKNLMVSVSGKVVAAGVDPLKTRVADEMPRAAYVALYAGTLLHVSTRDELIRHIADSASVQFVAGSEYAAQGRLYAEDLVTLANLLFSTGTDNLLLFDKISFLLYAHINKMRRRASLDDEEELRRPKLPPGRGPTRRNRKDPIDVGGVRLVFDLGDEELEAVAEDDPQAVFTQDQLRAVQTELGENNSQAGTLRLVERLLQPMFDVTVPKLFYRFGAMSDAGLDFESYAGGRLRGSVREVVLQGGAQEPLIVAILAAATRIVTFSVAVVPANAQTFEVRLNAATTPGILTAIAADAAVQFSATRAQAAAYTREARGRLIRSSELLLCFARYMTVRNGPPINLEVDALGSARIQVLQRYIDAEAKLGVRTGSTNNADFVLAENAAFEVFDSALLAGAVPNNVPSLLGRPPQKRWYKYIEGDTVNDANGAIADEIKEANAAVERADETLATLRRLRADRLADTHEEAEKTLADIVSENYTPSAQSVLSPLNSGVIFYSDLMMGALRESYDTLQQTIPCLAAQFCSYEGLIHSDEYWTRFASLVQAVVRLIDVRNSPIYRPVVMEQRARMQVRDALDSLRFVAGSDRHVRHVSGCTCNRSRTATLLGGTPIVYRHHARTGMF